ncbi:uncharacterized protein LOC129741867 isoform X2 [Uranotaenia lowii]|uniref:uncharacterized protein LOC129741867 isoform X2 n=1 Tax=Uranotaenia lowii TaxID=190385 RepID=UPI00247B2D6E|nr:uncharacterized protein LOC129741867 isoform X2 [Uranotaenia lowii]
MSEMSPSGADGVGGGSNPISRAVSPPPQHRQGPLPPIPAVRTSSLPPNQQQPIPQPRSSTQLTTQAIVHHHHHNPQQPAVSSQHPQPPIHLQPQVIIASGPPPGPPNVGASNNSAAAILQMQQQHQQQQQLHQLQQHQQQHHQQLQNPSNGMMMMMGAGAASVPVPPASGASSGAIGSNQIYPTSTGLVSGPRIVVLHRQNGDFGFTLRHFIVYPPPEATADPSANRLAEAIGMPNFAQPMDTVFVKKVHPNSSAFLAGLQEGDRLLAVNGIAVTSIPYAQVVATIQQTPKTLTLQVVPKNYDLLQTYFSETAYNPETNQRPQPQQPQHQTTLFLPKAASTPTPSSRPTSSNSNVITAAHGAAGVKRVLNDVQEKQESLYSTLQEIVGNAVAGGSSSSNNNGGNNKAIYAEVSRVRSPPVAAEAPQLHNPQQQQQRINKPLIFDFDPVKQQQYLVQQQQQQQKQLLQQQQLQQQQQYRDSDSISSYDSIKSGATLTASPSDVLSLGNVSGESGDSAIMSRLRKSFEQKEEFLRRPIGTTPLDVLQQREFYSRPNRLQKTVWPPMMPLAAGQQQQSSKATPVIATTTNNNSNINPNEQQDSLTMAAQKPLKISSGTQTAVPGKPVPTAREQHTSHLSAIREQFFSGVNGLNVDPYQIPPKSAPASLLPQQQLQPTQQQQQQPMLSPHSMHVVSEKAKLFESGRPLSPDGVDRAELYKSELSRLNPKQVVSNVSVRRKEFELKAESTGWRRSTEEKPRSVSSDSESHRTPIRVRSLSVESSCSSSLKDHSPVRPAANAMLADQDQGPQSLPGASGPGGCTLLRQRPVRENSYRNAVRNSTAFWLQGPASSGAFVPPPIITSTNTTTNNHNTASFLPPPTTTSSAQQSQSLMSPAPVSAPLPNTVQNSNGRVFSFNGSNGKTLTLGMAPIPPVRTYAAAHRLQPLSEEQFRMKMMHRNQTIVEVHSQPEAGTGSEQFCCSSDEGAGTDGDFDMKLLPSPSLYSQSPLLSPLLPLNLNTPNNNTGTNTSNAPRLSSTNAGSGGNKMAVRPTTLNLCSDANQVVMRQKQKHFHPGSGTTTNPLTIEEDERKTRRISYLRATAHDNLFQMMESDPSEGGSPMSLPPDTPDTEPETGAAAGNTSTTTTAASGATVTTTIDEESLVPGSVTGIIDHQLQSKDQQSQQLKSHSAKSKALAHFRDSPADPAAPLIREGELNVKVTLLDGKRSQDRSWRTVHAELRGNRLKLTLLRGGDAKSGTGQSPEPSGIIDLTNFHVAEGNYTKRKNVFKLSTVSYPQPIAGQGSSGIQQHQHLAQSHQHLAVHHTQSAGAVGLGGSSGPSSSVPYKGYERELLLQADSHQDMRLWMDSLGTVCRSSQYLNSSDYINSGLGGQQAEPQRVAALTSVQSTSNDEFSPLLSTKSHRKYALGSRSPSGQSPVTKSRKTPQQSSAAILTPAAVAHANAASHSGKESSDKETGSPKSKTWKGIVARQFRKMQGQPGSPGSQHPEILLPDGASINVPLQLCPQSEENPYVPLLLAKCTGIVESKGLGVIGIYRIPGNTAAISQLTEQVNRGMDETTLKDPKWEDVNVVSSLLKSFIRNLPEPLIPADLYQSFIQVDKLISGQQRLIELKQLLKRIPVYNYETLKHLMRHLSVISTNALVNLMDPRNMAIVFGPSVVRSANESLETAVKDMKHQCQIVEVLITHYQYFFEDDLLPNVVEKPATTTVDSGLEVPSTSLLLDNVSKIEPFKESSKESSSHFVAQIVQAANRKIRRTAQRKSTMSSTTPDSLSLDSTTSAESKEQSSRISHRYLLPGTAASLGAGRGGAGSGSQSDPGGASHHHHRHQHQHQVVVRMDESQKENHQYYHQQQQQQQQQQQMTTGTVASGATAGTGNVDGRHHSTQSNDDNSSVLNRSSEEDSNDSAFADNGSMSLNVVTIALDHKLRSIRNSSIDSDRDLVDTTTLESDGDNSSSCYSSNNGGITLRSSTPTRRSMHHSRPLTLGENIPYADESPERPLIPTRSKPLRQNSGASGGGPFKKSSPDSGSNNNLVNNNNTSGSTQQDDSVKSAQSQKSIDSGGTGTTTTGTNSTNDSCVTLINDLDLEEEDKVNNISVSSDDTDTSTTSNPREKLTSTYRIDTEVLKKMNRILTNLERKANNLERKFNLNRSLSLNYKNHKNLVECCCVAHVAATGQCCNNNNNNNSSCQNNLHSGHNQSQNLTNNNSSTGNVAMVRSRLLMTKDEKTDKNINRRRQIHDVSQTVLVGAGTMCCAGGHHGSSLGPGPGMISSSAGGQGPQIILTPTANNQQQQQQQSSNVGGGGRQRRQLGNRSIRRRHTVGGTHDYCSNAGKVVQHTAGGQCRLMQNASTGTPGSAAATNADDKKDGC